jgi:hypothetical protein
MMSITSGAASMSGSRSTNVISVRPSVHTVRFSDSTPGAGETRSRAWVPAVRTLRMIDVMLSGVP